MKLLSRLIISLGLLLCAYPAHAEDTATHYLLSVKLADKTNLSFSVSDELIVTFDDSTLTIESPDSHASYGICDVARLQYVKSLVSSAFFDIKDDCITLEGNSLVINRTEISHVEFYSVDGRLLRRTALDSSRRASLENLQGIVLVSVGSKSFKLCLGN